MRPSLHSPPPLPSHGFSPRELQSLQAICCTLLPSLPPPSDADIHSWLHLPPPPGPTRAEQLAETRKATNGDSAGGSRGEDGKGGSGGEQAAVSGGKRRGGRSSRREEERGEEEEEEEEEEEREQQDMNAAGGSTAMGGSEEVESESEVGRESEKEESEKEESEKEKVEGKESRGGQAAAAAAAALGGGGGGGAGGSSSLSSSRREAIRDLFRARGDDPATVDTVASLMVRNLKPAAVSRLRLLLLLLSSPLGSFLLCGRHALSLRPPFLRSFSSLPPEKRERALKGWNRSPLLPLRTAFKVFWGFLMSLVYSKIDDNGRNRFWPAIGYPGADPRLKSQGLTRGGTTHGPPCSAASPVSSSRLNPACCSEVEEEMDVSCAMPAGKQQQQQQQPQNRQQQDRREKQEEAKCSHPLQAAVVEAAGLTAGELRALLRERGADVKEESSEAVRAAMREREVEGEMIHVSCDVVIVGSGCGGSVVAAAAAGEGGRKKRVLVLDKGHFFSGSDFSLLESPSMTHLYERGGFLATEDASVSILSGVAVGGGSTVNWSASFKTPEHVIREWSEDFGLKHVASPQFAADLERVCERLSVQGGRSSRREGERQEGEGEEGERKEGEVWEGSQESKKGSEMSDPTLHFAHNLSNAALLRGAAALGFHSDCTPRNAIDRHECGWCSFGCPYRSKQSACETWLLDAAKNGALLLAGMECRRVLLQKGSGNGGGEKQGAATGREGEDLYLSDDGKKARAASRRVRTVGLIASVSAAAGSGASSAARQSSPKSGPLKSAAETASSHGITLVIDAPIVVVAAGSIRSPAILRISGLRNPNIGRNLRLHPVTLAWGFFPSHDHRQQQQQQHVAEDAACLSAASSALPSLPSGCCFEGAIMSAYSLVSANWREGGGYGAMLQTPSVHPGLFAAAVPWLSSEWHRRQMVKMGRVAAIIVITRDSGGGRVEVEDGGEVAIRYSLNRRDRNNMMDGLLNAIRILRAAGAAEVGTVHSALDPFVCYHPSISTSNLSDERAKDIRQQQQQQGDRVDGVDGQFESYLRRVQHLGFKKCSVGLFSAHQMGSCRMGCSHRTSVVDESGETWEASGLFLGDGSIFPSPSGVNPMVSIQAMALGVGRTVARRMTNEK